MEREKKEILLKRPFKGDNGVTVTKIVLQEPSASDFFALGAPQTWVRTPAGAALSENDEAIRRYVERAIVEPNPLLAMAQMSVLDAIAIKDAVLDFFQEPVPTP